MADLITLNCPACGNRLQITSDIERFTCRHCGAELLITRGPGGEATARIASQGPEHVRLDDLSPEARRAYEQMIQNILADSDRNGVPNVLETSGRAGVPAAAPAPAIAERRRRFGFTGGLSLLFGLFSRCVFPLLFVLPPLFSGSGQCAIAIAQDDPAVVRELGQPVRPVFSFTLYREVHY